MKTWRLLAATLTLLLLQNYLSAQDKLNIKFGKISPADFDISKQKYDSGAAAVIIADIGECHFEANPMRLIFKNHKRVKILKQAGFDIATVIIPFFAHQLIHSFEVLNYKEHLYKHHKIMFLILVDLLFLLHLFLQ